MTPVEKLIRRKLSLLELDHTVTKTKIPQTNGICERFHQTVLNEFFRVTFRKKMYGGLNEIQKDLDQYVETSEKVCKSFSTATRRIKRHFEP